MNVFVKSLWNVGVRGKTLEQENVKIYTHRSYDPKGDYVFVISTGKCVKITHRDVAMNKVCCLA